MIFYKINSHIWEERFDCFAKVRTDYYGSYKDLADAEEEAKRVHAELGYDAEVEITACRMNSYTSQRLRLYKSSLLPLGHYLS